MQAPPLNEWQRTASTSAFRWIAFDAVGTLVLADPPVRQVYFQAARRHGSRLSARQIAERFSRALRRSEQEEVATLDDWGRRDRLVTSEAHEERRWRRIVRKVLDDVADPDACFAELFEHFARPASWRCFPDVAAALRRLRRQGFRLAVASNFDRRLHALCDALPELKPLEVRAVSSEIGYRKPSLHFFRALAEMTASAPEQILLVGDDQINDVAGACAAGLPVLKIVRAGNDHAALATLADLPPMLRASL